MIYFPFIVSYTKSQPAHMFSGTIQVLTSLDTIQYNHPNAFNTHPLSLQSTYNQSLHLAIATPELQMATLEMQTNMTLMVINVAAEQNNIPIEHHIDGSNVAEVMLTLINEETTRLRAIQANPEDRDCTSLL